MGTIVSADIGCRKRGTRLLLCAWATAVPFFSFSSIACLTKLSPAKIL